MGLVFVLWLGIATSYEPLWMVALVASFLYLAACVFLLLWLRALGPLLCDRNRHSLAWVPDVPSEMVIHGTGIPLRSYIVTDPTEEQRRAQMVTSAHGSFVIARQESVCGRCGVALPTFEAHRRLLGWAV